MNHQEVENILSSELAALRRRGYAELAKLVNQEKSTKQVVSPSGTMFYVDTMVVWDGPEGGDVRVIAAIDDGGVRAFVPVSDDFILSPDG